MGWWERPLCTGTTQAGFYDCQDLAEDVQVKVPDPANRRKLPKITGNCRSLVGSVTASLFSSIPTAACLRSSHRLLPGCIVLECFLQRIWYFIKMLVLPLFKLLLFREGAIIVLASFLQEGWQHGRSRTCLFMLMLMPFFFLIPRLYARTGTWQNFIKM